MQRYSKGLKPDISMQDAEGKQREKAERLRFGRFFYRFPNGESGADVYDRMTIFEVHCAALGLLGKAACACMMPRLPSACARNGYVRFYPC